MTTSLEIDGWKANIRFSSSHILLGHNKCGFLHGHTYAIHTWVYGDIDEIGFIIDFKIVKNALREIANRFDHRVLIPDKNSNVSKTESEISIFTDNKNYIFPIEDCIVLPLTRITAEYLSEYILEELFDKIDLPKNVKKIVVGIDEGYGQVARSEKIIG